MQISVVPTMQPVAPVNTRNVRSGPEPRRITLLLPLIVRPPVSAYVPGFSFTTCPLGQLAIAELIWAAVAPGLSVAQFVVQLGIPPLTPARQVMLRTGAMIVCWENIRAELANRINVTPSSI